MIAFLFVCIALGPEADWSSLEKSKVGIMTGAGATETQDRIVSRRSRAGDFDTEKGEAVDAERG